MTIVIDANIAIAVLDTKHAFHRRAIERCVEDGDVAILNLTRAEALIHPARSGALVGAEQVLDRLGMRVEVVSRAVADIARDLRSVYGNRHFPMIDAVVVAFGIELGCPAVTCDAKWPNIVEASIEVLARHR